LFVAEGCSVWKMCGATADQPFKTVHKRLSVGELMLENQESLIGRAEPGREDEERWKMWMGKECQIVKEDHGTGLRTRVFGQCNPKLLCAVPDLHK